MDKYAFPGHFKGSGMTYKRYLASILKRGINANKQGRVLPGIIIVRVALKSAAAIIKLLEEKYELAPFSFPIFHDGSRGMLYLQYEIGNAAEGFLMSADLENINFKNDTWYEALAYESMDQAERLIEELGDK